MSKLETYKYGSLDPNNYHGGWQHKYSGKPPWEQDGIKIQGFDSSEEQNIQTQIKNKLTKATEISLYESIADFYLLDAIQAGIVTGNTRTLYSAEAFILFMDGGFPIRRHTIEFDATRSFAQTTQTLAASFETYLWYALATELWYSPVAARSLGYDPFAIVLTLQCMRCDFGDARVAEWVERVFLASGWYSSYGGKAWANIANVLKLYYQKEINGQLFTSREFCDRVFSLQHNTGTCLNKMPWGSKGNRKHINSNKLKKILDLHAKSDLENLATYADHEVQELYNTAKNQPIKKLVKKTKG